MKDDFNYFMPFGKVDKTTDGARIVSGYASTTRLDLDNEIVSMDAMKNALPGYMAWRNIRQMHQAIPVGTAKEAHVDEDGLYLTARIVDPACIKLIDEDVLKGFSIGGKKLQKKGNTITDIELIEISVVDRPANPDCSFSVQKSAKDVVIGKTVYVDASTAVVGSDDERGWLRKMVEQLVGHGVSGAALVDSVTDTIGARLGKSAVVPEDAYYAELCKREFSDSERSEAAASGEAMPGGGYPIKSVQDLKNAVQAFGRAKDKDATKRHIVKRAKALKATEHLPQDWQAEKAATVSLLTLADDPIFGGTGLSKMLNDPLFGGDGSVDLLADPLFGAATPQTLVEFLKSPQAAEVIKKSDVRDRLSKGCGVVADLAYAFGCIRDAQRRLLAEGFIEKDGDDHGMATKLGSIASDLATVMAQKATHEASEAIFLTDADDIQSYVLTSGVLQMNQQTTDLLKRGKGNLGKAAQHLMKAGASNAKCMGCMAKLGAMHGAAVRKAAAGGDLAKADGFDHAGAMSLIREMHGHAQEANDHMEMAHQAMAGGESNADATAQGKANGSVVGDWGGSSVTGVGEGERTEGEVPWYSATDPYPGKAARGDTPGGYISKREVDLMLENATMKGRLEAMAKTPSGVFKGRSVMASTIGDQTGLAAEGGSGDNLSILMKGIDGVDQNDPTSVKDAAGRMIGNMLANANKFGKSVFDPAFKGGAGIKR